MTTDTGKPAMRFVSIIGRFLAQFAGDFHRGLLSAWDSVFY